MLLARPVVRMPTFGRGEWLNGRELSTEELRGRVVLVDFWDYACINCVRTLPYVTDWHGRYAEKGLTVIGIHTPEFKFGRQRAQVEAAVDEFQLAYPILLDNQQENWDRFTNKAWPTKYLIDHRGYIRYQRRGEGGYADTEIAIQRLLKDRDPQVEVEPIRAPLRPEDAPGAACYKTTPELYAGFSAGLFGGMLGNEEGYAPREVVVYEMPTADEREEGRLYAAGIWRALPEALVFEGHEHGRIRVPYEAAGVNVVLSPSGDEVDLMLGLKNGAAPLVEVQLNGRPVPAHLAGQDLFCHDNRMVVRVTRPRMYELVRHPGLPTADVELIFRDHGTAVYTFTFTSCVKPQA